MNWNSEQDPVVARTRSLCQALVDHPELGGSFAAIGAFLENEPSRDRYRAVVELGEALQSKQQTGQSLDPVEIERFEASRQALMEDSVTQAFLEAQSVVHKITASVEEYIKLTFELKRVPNPADFEGGGCGPSCGCH